jgi:small neutral amino acid transporter SnatA (MarC family)
VTPRKRVTRAGLVLALLLVATFGIASPPERCPSVTAADVQRSARAATNWFVRNQNPDGTWLYLYRPKGDEVPDEYNVVRHAGAIEGLYQAAEAGIPGALESADRGTEWALDHLIEHGDWSAVSWSGGTETGSTALLLAGLDIRRHDTGDTKYDDVMRRLGRFLVSQVEPSGAVLAYYDPARGGPIPDEYSKYYTGEAYWALARLHQTFPDDGFGTVADRVGAYLATERDDAEGYWPGIADHWAGYGLAETAAYRRLTDDEVDYARRQAGLFGSQARWIEARFGPWGLIARGSPVPRGGGYGVINEGFTGLWRAAADPRLADIRGPIAQRTACMAGLAIEAQADAAEAASTPKPARVEGAWFRDGETRMDDQQHALAAQLRAVAVLEAHGSSDDDSPSPWLWALVLVLALNPARAAFGVPRREALAGHAALAGRDAREARALAARGGALGALLVCVAALIGDVLLDAVDVSAPAFATAAGIIAVLVGVIDLVRRPPSPEPALPGRRAAIVPVAIPIVARPTLVVIALGAGILTTAGAMVVAVAALIALAPRPTDGPGGRVLRWAARLLAAGLIVAGVLLGIDGIFGV